MLVFIISFLILGCVRESNVVSNNNRNTYDIQVAYEPVKSQISGVECLTYNNCYNSDKIYFHLYPNMYNKKETSPEYNIFTDSYPDGFNPGGIEIQNVKLFGKNIKYNVENTILEINIPNSKRKMNTLDIEIHFIASLPNAKSRFGVYNEVANVSYWYPILCMYDEGKWDKEGFYFIGESSYSDVADYNVKITLPEEYVVCATGNKINERKLQNKIKEVEYEESNIRDFVWFASNKFKTKQKNIDDITINYFYLDDINDKPIKVLEGASSIIDYYNNSFGYYPYKQFNIVKSEVVTSEFPQAITIADSNLGTHDWINYALAHEIAHQWWYLTVGNNQREEPWLDEAFAVYSMTMYLRDRYGKEFADNSISKKKGTEVPPIAINSPVTKFTDLNTYSEIVYDRGSIVLYDLNSRVGDNVFNSIMKRYYGKYKFKNATTKDFINIVEEAAGIENAKWLKNELENVNHPADKPKKAVLNNDTKTQLEIIKTQKEKLKDGEFTRIQLDSSTTKIIFKPIIYNEIEALNKYNSFIPLIKHKKIHNMPFTQALLYPNADYLEQMNTKINNIEYYEVKCYSGLDNLTYMFGEFDKDFIWVFLLPLENEDGMAYKSYKYVLSNGNKIGDNIYRLKKEESDIVTFTKTFNQKEYGIMILSNINDIELIHIIKNNF